MSNKLNQYGRRTWNIEEYEEKSRNKDTKKTKIEVTKNDLTLNGLLKQVNTQNNNNSRFGIENSWFTCKLCNRRFKDSLKLTEHYSSRQHKENLSKHGVKETNVEFKEINLENVKLFLQMLKSRKDN